MIPSIARQSVITKCNMQKSILLGNYEFYYVGGLLNKLFGLRGNPDMDPQALREYLDGELPRLTPEDDREKYLIHMVENYDPLPDYDEQMKLLFRWGESEEYLWQMKTDQQVQE